MQAFIVEEIGKKHGVSEGAAFISGDSKTHLLHCPVPLLQVSPVGQSPKAGRSAC